MPGVQISHSTRASHVVWPDLDDLFVLLLLLKVAALDVSHVWVSVAQVFLEHLECNQVKDWNHVSRIILQLFVKCRLELMEMLAVNFKCVLFSLDHFLQL